MVKRNYLNLTQISLGLTDKEGNVRLNSPYRNYQELIEEFNNYIDSRIREERIKYDEMKNCPRCNSSDLAKSLGRISYFCRHCGLRWTADGEWRSDYEKK
jgi:hypothetical protein